MQTILFQGDSITDVGRDRGNDSGWSGLGCGYPLLVSAQLGLERPDAFRFLNRGISGDRSIDVYARIKKDIINLEPDYISLLIGVNDVWHELGNKDGVSAEKFERVCTMLVEEILDALPQTKLLLLEPFLAHGDATNKVWSYFRGEVELRAAAIRRIAEKFGQTFVPLQRAFDDAERIAAPEHWTAEGVHPTFFGHALIARCWREAFDSIQ